jgi:hypothetical protein
MTIKYHEIVGIDNEVTEWVTIEVAPNQFQSMSKEVYDKQQAEQSTPMVAPE